jgi:hypothetical protein
MAVFLSIQFFAFVSWRLTSKAGNILLFSLMQDRNKVLQNAVDRLYSRYANDLNTCKYGFAGTPLCHIQHVIHLRVADFS